MRVRRVFGWALRLGSPGDISFNTKVERVHRRPHDGIFDVTISGNGASGGNETREYDAVMICNGHHWDARWPDPPLGRTAYAVRLRAKARFVSGRAFIQSGAAWIASFPLSTVTSHWLWNPCV